jgi:hypothetical protein
VVGEANRSAVVNARIVWHLENANPPVVGFEVGWAYCYRPLHARGGPRVDGGGVSGKDQIQPDS